VPQEVWTPDQQRTTPQERHGAQRPGHADYPVLMLDAFQTVDFVIAGGASNPEAASDCSLDCFASLAMTARYNSAFPPRDAPELMQVFSPRRARRYPKGERGMPGARCTRSRAW
jgi:hypothetical protein